MTIEVRADRLVPTVEINIPKTHSRRISGVFAQREKGSKSKLHLLHRGLVNVFRGPIPKRTTLAAFADRVELCGDEGATIELIYVCAVSEGGIGQSLYDFAKRMRKLKNKVRRARQRASQSVA